MNVPSLRLALVATAAAIAVVHGACLGAAAQAYDPGPDATPREREGCQLVARRCSRCHTTERVYSLKVSEPVAFRTTVRRMRLLPGSGIRDGEEALIVECLVRRSFGAAGIAAIQGGPP